MTSLPETPSPDTDLSIELTNGPQSIRELYFKDGQGSVFTYRRTKITLLLALFFMLLSSVFYFLSLSSDQISYVVIFTFTSLIGAALLLQFLTFARKYFKWKKSVSAMIERAGSYKKVCLHVKSGGFEAVYDDQVFIEKWSNFDRATISPTHIYLSRKDANYLFPPNSMRKAGYEALAHLIRS